MNTTPKARKFRIRRSPALGGDGPAVAGPTAVPPAPPPVPGPTPRPDASQQMPDNQVMMDLGIVAPQEENIDEQIDAIRRECRISFPLGFMGGVVSRVSAVENSRFIARL